MSERACPICGTPPEALCVHMERLLDAIDDPVATLRRLDATAEAQEEIARADSNDVAIEDVRAIAVALGLGGHARPYSAHEVVRREILPAVAEALAAVERAEELAEQWDEMARDHDEQGMTLGAALYRAHARHLRRALDGEP